jgi:hypothetical protein
MEGVRRRAPRVLGGPTGRTRPAGLGRSYREWSAEALPWLLGVAVIGAIYGPEHDVLSARTAITALLGLGVVVLAAKRPDRSLILLVLLLPFSDFILSELYRLGAPESIVRHASAWKETLAVGIVLAGARAYVAEGRRADVLDRLAVAFVALIALYLVAQKVIVPGTPTSVGTRVLAFRQDAGFVLVLLGARHAPLPDGFLNRLARAVIVSAVVVAGACVFETIDSAAWNRFVVNTIRYTAYETNVLNSPPVNPSNIGDYAVIGSATIIRPGSVFLSPLTCGFYLVLGFALTLEQGIERRAGVLRLFWLLLIGAGIVLTETRSAILAALIVALVAFQPSAGRRRHWRTQLTLFALALALAVVPALTSTSLLKRIGGPGVSSDNAGHLSGLSSGLATVEAHPLGLGLGTSAGIGQRASASGSAAVIPENDYLEVGIEAGALSMLAFVALTVVLVLKLRRAARTSAEPVVSAVWAAALGLAVAAFFLQAWVDFSVAWPVWGLCGAALGATRAPRVAQRPDPFPAEVATPIPEPREWTAA